MILFSFLILPIFTALILRYYFHKKVTKWEYLVPFISVLIMILISKVVVESTNLYHKEYWGSLVTEVRWYEAWNEYIQQTCSQTCCCDSNGNNCRTTTYDCSYVNYHPDKYIIYTSSGEEFSISKSVYESLKYKFGNNTLVDMHRHYHTNDGDMYKSIWDKSYERHQSVTSTHQYENKVKASDYTALRDDLYLITDSIKFQYGLYDYPSDDDIFNFKSLIGYDNVDANVQLNYYNGLYGSSKQVRMFILVFHNQPIETAVYQQSYWVNGNMNEFVVCVGKKDKHISWVRAFSWTPNEYLTIDVNRQIRNIDTFDIHRIVDVVGETVGRDFIRRDFEEFDYIKILPESRSIIIVGVLSLLICIITSIIVIRNEIY